MSTIEASLLSSRLFRGADPRALADSTHRWTPRELREGEMLWYEADAATELALLVDGELEVIVEGQPISRVRAGELVGEAGAFIAGDRRTATVRATSRTHLLVLPQAALAKLRADQPELYDLLLEQALRVIAERVEITLGRISALAGGAAPDETPRGRRTSTMPAATPPSPIPALRMLPALQSAPEETLAVVAAAMAPAHLGEGETLVKEGDAGDWLYLVVDGRLDVTRRANTGRPLPLAVLRAGALVGTGGFLLGHPRNATCTARRPSWIYGLDRAAFDGLGGEPGRLFREALLCALRAQMRSVGSRQARFVLAGPDGQGRDRTLDELLELGSMFAYQGGLRAAPIVPAALPFHDEVEPADPGKRRLVEYVRGSVIGADEAIETPYGTRRVTYADHTASGRCLSFVEDFLRQEVMPFYANTHSEASGTGRQTGAYREDARAIIRACVNAGEKDAVIFCGSGATGAIARLIDILQLRLPTDLDRRYRLAERIPAEERPVVFIGPYEHHSNELPWRHSLAEVVVIDDDEDGRIDLARLEDALLRHADRPLKIGSFSAASNVTGIVSDVPAVSTLLHRHGALSFWDYAAAGPHVKVDMNPPGDPLACKDAVFLSPHKLIGGPGSPGLLVVKRHLVKNTVPVQPGGGTVALVTPEETLYWQDPEHREEGGTPAILESIRAGLAFQLKRAVGEDVIEEVERGFIRRALATWQQNPYLRILGSAGADRLAIVSFMVRYRDHYLHNNFVVTLLNDLFGIQARGGCSCAGPYMHRLLGLSVEKSREYVEMVDRGFVSLKPGWSRVSFNYFISNAEFRYIVAAVDMLARHGHLLLPEYRFDIGSGQWNHVAGQPHRPMRLADLSYDPGRLEHPSRHVRLPEDVLDAQLEAALRVFERARETRGESTPGPLPLREPSYERLRWFAMPEEVVRDMRPRV